MALLDVGSLSLDYNGWSYQAKGGDCEILNVDKKWRETYL
jgi:hypothetical protein